MALTAPNLDNLTFQQIVDQAKKLIPRYCPEWTDHNVSDPGITLLELFAGMTEMLLYRVNQVPDKMYITFLNLIGIRLQEARAAQVPITFYLSTYDLQGEVRIRAGTEVATVRTEVEQAIVFTTETELIIHPPALRPDAEAYTYSATDGWRRIELRRKATLNEPIDIFPESLAPGDAFCLALAGNHSHNMLALRLGVANAGGSGVNPKEPPIRWEVWNSATGEYLACEVEQDSTGGFNEDGEVVLHLPAMSEQEIGSDGSAFLLYCRLTEGQADRNRNYQQVPQLLRLHIEARGGTAQARQAVVVRSETLGQSDGTPGQMFKLKHAPLLARRSEHEHLIVRHPDGTNESWQEVRDFADSGAADRHYTLDSQDGTLTFGPLLPQPNGEAYCFGAIPPLGSTLVFTRYQYGGGVYGNVPRGSIRVLKSAIPFVTRVANRRDATGGQDAQVLEDAKLRAPRQLRDRTRAVTADDYEYLARQQVPGVVAARCLGPNAQPGQPNDLRPGQIMVVVLPALDQAAAPPELDPLPEQALHLPDDLRNAVYQELSKRSLLGTELQVRAPRYIQVVVEAQVQLQERGSPRQRDAIKQQIERLLYRYLNPYTGGPSGKGWPFGRSLHNAEIRSLIQQHIEDIEFIEQLDLHANDLYDASGIEAAATRVTVPEDGLICSGRHRVNVIM